MTSIAQILRDAAGRLPGDDARAEAELLLADCLGRTRAWLFAHAQDALDHDASVRFLALLRRRQQGEPVAQILGRRGFWSLELIVSADTLVPRPETELLVELALTRIPLQGAMRVLDLGTGTGAIALAVASERPRALVTAVEASAGAFAVAQRNAAKLGLERVRLLRSDWFSALAGERFALILSNPPYLAEDDPHLATGDLRFEPRSALVAGDGLEDIRRIVREAPQHLDAGGWLLIEHGWEQGERVRSLFVRAGFALVETARDLEQRERVTLGQWQPAAP